MSDLNAYLDFTAHERAAHPADSAEALLRRFLGNPMQWPSADEIRAALQASAPSPADEAGALMRGQIARAHGIAPGPLEDLWTLQRLALSGRRTQHDEALVAGAYERIASVLVDGPAPSPAPDLPEQVFGTLEGDGSGTALPPILERAAAEGSEPLDWPHVHIIPLGYGDHEAAEGETYSLVQCRECMEMLAIAPGRKARAAAEGSEPLDVLPPLSHEALEKASDVALALMKHAIVTEEQRRYAAAYASQASEGTE